MAVNRKALDKAEGKLSSSIEDVRQWQPSRPEGNPYDTSELERMYGQSYSTLKLGQAMYNTALTMVQESISDFKGRLGLLEVEAAQAQRDIYSGDSMAQAEGTAALEQNLMTQSRMGKDMTEGSQAWQQSQLVSQMGADNSRIAAATGAAASSENLAKDAQYYESLAGKNRGLIAALGGKASGAMAAQRLAGGSAQVGLQGMQRGAQSLTEGRLGLAGQHMTYGGMSAQALQARMGSRGAIAGAEQSAVLTREKARSDARAAKRARLKRIVGGAVSAGTAGISGAIGMKGKKKNKGGKK